VIESLSIDKIEEKYVIVMGALEELAGKEKEFVGIRIAGTETMSGFFNNFIAK